MMRTEIGKILSVMVCVVMVASAFVMAVPSIPKPRVDEFEEEMGEIGEAPVSPVPKAHGTRAQVIEGTMMDEALPTCDLDNWGYGNTIGVKFEVDYDVTVKQLGFYNDSYSIVYNLRLWDADIQTLLAEWPCPNDPSIGWTWFDIPPINLYAGGTYIVSARIYPAYVKGIENLNPGGLIDPIAWVRGYGNSFPGIQVSDSLFPLVDLRYIFAVDIIVPDQYSSIQDAIDAANPWNRIFVRENSVPYNEELTIDKSLILIGEKRNTTIIDGKYVGGSRIVVHINADHIWLRGFTITGGDYGVYCDHADWVYIYNDIVKENNDYGVYLDTTTNSTIKHNTISHNNFDGDADGFGIYLLDSHALFIRHNLISYNKVGVKITDSWIWGGLNENTFIGNDIAVDYDPKPLKIDGNVFINNTIAIKISGDNSTVIISNNNITGSEIGIYIESGSPIIEGNIITNNHYGIYYTNDSSPIILNNTFSNNVFDIYYAILALLDIDPDTLNLKSKGRWITCYIELPKNMDVKNISVSTLKISCVNGDSVDIPAESHPTEIDDYDNDSVPDLMVKFDRSEVEDNASPGDATITLTGEFTDGTEFEGYDTIRVTDPGK